jgi:hypothetical protein
MSAETVTHAARPSTSTSTSARLRPSLRQRRRQDWFAEAAIMWPTDLITDIR